MNESKLAADEAEAFCSCGWGVRASADDPRVTAADWASGPDEAAVPPVTIASRLASRLVVEHRIFAHRKSTLASMPKTGSAQRRVFDTPTTPPAREQG